MTVYVLNSVSDNFDISEREFLGIVDFAIKELSIPNTTDIHFDFEFLEEYYGFCHNYEQPANSYTVIIRPSISWINMVKTIFHELTHVKQNQTGELCGTVWRGVPIDATTYDFHDQLPWEVAAYAMEEHLYNKFILLEANDG